MTSTSSDQAREEIARFLNETDPEGGTDDGTLEFWFPQVDALMERWPFLVGVTDEMVDTFKRAWHEADERGRTGDRVRAGLTAVLGASRRSRDDDAPGDGGTS